MNSRCVSCYSINTFLPCSDEVELEQGRMPSIEELVRILTKVGTTAPFSLFVFSYFIAARRRCLCKNGVGGRARRYSVSGLSVGSSLHGVRKSRDAKNERRKTPGVFEKLLSRYTWAKRVCLVLYTNLSQMLCMAYTGICPDGNRLYHISFESHLHFTAAIQLLFASVLPS